MADITVTAANVLKAAGGTVIGVTAGGTVTAGQLVYKDTADSDEYKAADADAQATAALAGIALNGGADGQPIDVLTSGNINPGGTVTVGEVYCVSTTAGGIAPHSDLLTGDFVSILGIGTTTSNIKVDISVSGVAKP